MSDADKSPNLDCRTCGEAAKLWAHGEFSGLVCVGNREHVEVLKMPTGLRFKTWVEANPNASFGLVLLLVLGFVFFVVAAIAAIPASMTCGVERSRGLNDTMAHDDYCWKLNVKGKDVGCFYDDGGLDAAEARFGCVDALRVTK